MKYIMNIIVIIWYLIWILSFAGMTFFVSNSNIVWSNICSVTFGMGFYQMYYLVWNSKNKTNKVK